MIEGGTLRRMRRTRRYRCRRTYFGHLTKRRRLRLGSGLFPTPGGKRLNNDSASATAYKLQICRRAVTLEYVTKLQTPLLGGRSFPPSRMHGHSNTERLNTTAMSSFIRSDSPHFLNVSSLTTTINYSFKYLIVRRMLSQNVSLTFLNVLPP